MENREAIRILSGVSKYADKVYREALTLAISALEKQEQSCDTCKHGYFGDTWCERCAVRFASHYEAEEES